MRAFSPEEAVKVSNAALDASEQLVNQMNDKMREDAVAIGRYRAPAFAVEALADTRANLQKIRNEEGMLDAKQQGTAVMTADFHCGRRRRSSCSRSTIPTAATCVPDAPQMRNLQTKLDAAQKQLDALKAQVTRSPNVPRTTAARCCRARPRGSTTPNLENQIAEKIYGGSVAALEKAQDPVGIEAPLPQCLHPPRRGASSRNIRSAASTCCSSR